MPDSKITALTALTAADPANDMFPIVDVSDTSMAASGTTKRISINNLLAASGTATLASATITGDLTVDTSTLKVDSANNRVGILTASPAAALHVNNGNIRLNDGYQLEFGGGFNSISGSNASNYLLFYINNSEAMRLNSTGLGVGVTPAAGDGSGVFKAAGTGVGTANTRMGIDTRETTSGNAAGIWIGAMNSENTGVIGSRTASGNIAFQTFNGSAWGERMRIDYTGNVGIGVTPSAWRNTQRALQFGAVGSLFSSTASTGATCIGRNVYESTAGDFTYIVNDEATFYEQTATGTHAWYTAAAGTGTISFGSAKMTLDASGNLLVGSALPVSGGRISGNSSSGPAGRFFSSAGDNQFAAMFDKSSATNTTSQWLIGFTINNQSTGSGQINANGASQAAFGTFSDSRLKENILSLPSQLANILSLRPVEFDYKDGSGHQIGFVAQEMQEVYSDAVGEQNGFLTVTGWSKTEARLVSAIKELAAKVQALEAKLA